MCITADFSCGSDEIRAITYYYLFCFASLLAWFITFSPFCLPPCDPKVHCHQGYLISRKQERGTRSEDAQTYPSQKSTY